MEYLFTIADRFEITGRGCVLVPGIPESIKIPIRVKDRILIRLPSGIEVTTYIAGLELINYGSRKRPVSISAPILLPKEIKKEDITDGSEVYLLTDDSPQK